jgi:hypothetical protein
VRHLFGTALAVGMTVVMFFGGAWGYLKLLKLPVPPGQARALPASGGSLLSDHTALLALAALVAIAVLAGMLAVIPRISPLASGLPGLLFLAWTALYLVNVRQAVNLIPLRSRAFGAGWEALLFNGILGAAGAAMVVPLFVPSRWRRVRRAEADADGEAEAGAATQDVDDYLIKLSTAAKPDQDHDQDNWKQAQDDWKLDDQPLVGTILPRRPPGTSRIDTSRVTGASRALRNTGTFHMSTGARSHPTGSMPRANGAHGKPADHNPFGAPHED